MSDVFSLFEEEAANPQAFDKVGEDGTKRLSSLIRQTIDLNKQKALNKKLKINISGT